MEGWIKLHRRVLEWEWYNDANTFRVFIHLLIKANSKDASWRGEDIKRGQLITSIAHLSEELKLSPKQIRIALGKLKKTSEIVTERANNATRINICKYDTYQSKPDIKGQTKGQTLRHYEGKEGANEGQTKGDKQEGKEKKDFKDPKKDSERKKEEKSLTNNFHSLTPNFGYILLDDLKWLEDRSKQMDCSLSALSQYAKEFTKTNLKIGKQWTSLEDIHRHFISWVELQPKFGRKPLNQLT